jgi:hypothetical protein
LGGRFCTGGLYHTACTLVNPAAERFVGERVTPQLCLLANVVGFFYESSFVLLSAVWFSGRVLWLCAALIWEGVKNGFTWVKYAFTA